MAVASSQSGTGLSDDLRQSGGHPAFAPERHSCPLSRARFALLSPGTRASETIGTMVRRDREAAKPHLPIRASAARLAATFLMVLLATLASPPTAGQGTDEVDTALIVAVDVSNSVDDKRYRLQMEGIAQALEDPGVIQAIVGG